MTVKLRETMAKEEEYDKLPDKDAAKEFYAKYEPKEILGRWVLLFCLFVLFTLLLLFPSVVYCSFYCNIIW